MTINPVDLWASSYESKWKDVFKASQGDGFDAQKAAADAWANWNDSNANKLQCIPPLTPPNPLTGTTNEKSFAPVDFSSARTPAQSAKVLADAWKTWASAITWAVVPPGPPYTALTSVITDPASVTSAHTTLLSGLIAEMAIVPANEAAVPAKYKAIGQLFYKAASGLQVKFIGLGTGSPPPPLLISVPVF